MAISTVNNLLSPVNATAALDDVAKNSCAILIGGAAVATFLASAYCLWHRRDGIRAIRTEIPLPTTLKQDVTEKSRTVAPSSNYLATDEATPSSQSFPSEGTRHFLWRGISGNHWQLMKGNLSDYNISDHPDLKNELYSTLVEFCQNPISNSGVNYPMVRDTGETPLHLAAKAYLTLNMYWYASEDIKGRPILDITTRQHEKLFAEQRGYMHCKKAILEPLMRKGADPTIKDKAGNTVFSIIEHIKAEAKKDSRLWLAAHKLELFIQTHRSRFLKPRNRAAFTFAWKNASDQNPL